MLARLLSRCSPKPTDEPGPLRRAALALVSFKLHPAVSFDGFIMGLILVSSLAMGLEDCHLDLRSPLALRLHRLNLAATAVFTLELVAKMLAHGTQSYLSNGWNCMDALIVFTSLLSTLGASSPALQAMRMLRVLRPLRLLVRFDGLRIAVTLLLGALPKCIDVGLVYILFLDVFAILAVQFFSGASGRCAPDPALSTRAACEEAGGTWSNPSWGTFDNVFSASLVLFEMSSLEDRPVVLFAATDMVCPDAAPQRDHSLGNAVFFLAWVFLGSCVLLNLFVGVLITTFAEVRRRDEGTLLMSDEQKAWAEALQTMLTLRPVRFVHQPTSAIPAACFRIARHRAFENLILVVIVLNTALMALEGYGISEEREATLAAMGEVCAYAFVAEACIKIAAFGLRSYLSNGWNVFDFSIVLLSLIELALMHATVEDGTPNPMLGRLLRVVRVARVLRTLRVVKGMRMLSVLLGMLLVSLPALINIVGIYCVVLSMYALLGMHLFGGVRHGAFINDDANFCTFGTAALTLFRCSTGEGWNGIMHDAMATPGSSDCSYEAGDCGTGAAVPFFVSYVVLTSYIVLKMMIALIIENFVLALKQDASSLQPEHAQAFITAWSEYDPHASGLMDVKHLRELIMRLPPPLGLDPSQCRGRVVRESDVAKYIFQMDLKTREKGDGTRQAHFGQVLACLVKDSYSDSSHSDSLLAEQDAEEQVAELHAGGWRRKSRRWEAVLPDSESKLGQRVLGLLERHQIDVLDEASEREGGGERIGRATAQLIIARGFGQRLEAARRRLEAKRTRSLSA